MPSKYFDKNGKVIRCGDMLKHKSGVKTKVYQWRGTDLCLKLDTYDFLRFHPFFEEEYNPLSSFKLNEWEVA